VYEIREDLPRCVQNNRPAVDTFFNQRASNQSKPRPHAQSSHRPAKASARQDHGDFEGRVLLTTDDRLLHIARRHANLLRTKIANPLVWVQDMQEGQP